MSDLRKKTTAFIAEIDPVELGVLLFEAVVGIKRRPSGLTAKQALALMPPDDAKRVLRAAEVACEYVSAQINKSVAPS